MKRPICDTCDDTHSMLMHFGSDERMVMCTRCPVPCPECGKGGPFCLTTPCPCECHKGHWMYEQAKSTQDRAEESPAEDDARSDRRVPPRDVDSVQGTITFPIGGYSAPSPTVVGHTGQYYTREKGPYAALVIAANDDDTFDLQVTLPSRNERRHFFYATQVSETPGGFHYFKRV